jgi:hypothetical protein
MVNYQEERKRLKVIFHATEGKESPYWGLLKYYQTQDQEGVRQMMIVEAAAVYWMPFTARLRVGNDRYAEQELVWRSIYQLQQRINELESQFQLESLPPESWRLSPLGYIAPEPVTFNFSYRADAQTEQGILAQYLMESSVGLTLEKKILWSSDAYWSAIAYRELGVLEEEQLKRCASNCIIRLWQHVNFLGNYFRVIPNFPLTGTPLFTEGQWQQRNEVKLPAEESGEKTESRPSKTSSELNFEEEEAQLMDNPVYDQWGMSLFKDSF